MNSLKPHRAIINKITHARVPAQASFDKLKATAASEKEFKNAVARQVTFASEMLKSVAVHLGPVAGDRS